MNCVTEFTSFITPDGVEYKFDTSHRFILTEEGFGAAPVTYITQKGPFQHGESIIDFRLTPRTIQMVIRNNGDSRQDYWNNRSGLLNALRPNRSLSGQMNSGKLRKIFQDGSIRDIDVVCVSGPGFVARDLSRWDEWGFTETLRFIAYDPTFYNPVEQVVTWATMIVSSFAGYMTFPITFPLTTGTILSDKSDTVTYAGSWLSYPRIKATGPIENLILQNESTGERISFLYDIQEGEEVTFDLSYGNKTVISSTGANLIGAVSSDSDLVTFHLAPDPEVVNGINEISVSASAITDESGLEIRYYERFVGI